MDEAALVIRFVGTFTVVGVIILASSVAGTRFGIRGSYPQDGATTKRVIAIRSSLILGSVAADRQLLASGSPRCCSWDADTPFRLTCCRISSRSG
jgi:hypothetical protein